MRWRLWRREPNVWFRCENPARRNDSRMRWHYEDCGRCAGAARQMGRNDVLDTMRNIRLAEQEQAT